MILTVTLNPAIDFTVFGEEFIPHQTNRGQDIAPDPGGKGNNAARIAKRLGSEAMVTGFIGGFTGDYIQSQLRLEGMQTAYYIIDRTTRMTVSFIEKTTGKETKIVPFGPEITDDEAEAFCHHYDHLIRTHRFSIVALCGSLPRGLPADFYGRLIDIAGERDTPAILDSSGEALSAGIEHYPFLIKPNVAEAMELAGVKRDDVFDSMKELCSKAKLVALTMEAEGAIFFSERKTVKVHCEARDAINPVGAGDAFIGGFAAAFDRFGPDEEKLFSWAVTAGTCTAHSAGLLWSIDDFEKRWKWITIREIG